MRPPFGVNFWSRFGGGGGPARESKAVKIRTRLVPCPLKNTPVPPSTGGGGFTGLLPPTPLDLMLSKLEDVFFCHLL